MTISTERNPEDQIIQLAEKAAVDGDWWPVASWKDGPGSAHRALFGAMSPKAILAAALLVRAARGYLVAETEVAAGAREEDHITSQEFRWALAAFDATQKRQNSEQGAK